MAAFQGFSEEERGIGRVTVREFISASAYGWAHNNTPKDE